MIFLLLYCCQITSFVQLGRPTTLFALILLISNKRSRLAMCLCFLQKKTAIKIKILHFFFGEKHFLEWQIFNTLHVMRIVKKLDSLHLKNGKRYQRKSKSIEFRVVLATCIHCTKKLFKQNRPWA